jgi:hypothetical protein
MDKNLKFKINIIEFDFKTIIDDWVILDCRNEAYDIIDNLLSWKDIKSYNMTVELIIFHLTDNGNLFLLHLDYVKCQLVKSGIMESGGKFGSPFLDDI